MKKTLQLAAAAAALAVTAGAHAAVDYSNDFGNAVWVTDTAQVANFSSAGGAGTVSFHLDGFNTLDGDNYYIDVFTLSVNGAAVFSGTWNLGGGGADEVFQAPAGTTLTKNGTSSLDISVPVSLLAGANSVSFAYDSPAAFASPGQGVTGRAGFQGWPDEGWGLGVVTVSSAVPEPASGALLLASLGLVAGVARRRAK
jgi:hypothetical protein